MKKWKVENWVWDGAVLDAAIIYFTDYEEAKYEFDRYSPIKETIAIKLIEYQEINGKICNEQTLKNKKNTALLPIINKKYLTWIL